MQMDHPDVAELGRPLEDDRLDAGPLERDRGAQAADPGSDNDGAHSADLMPEASHEQGFSTTPAADA
jgi:hypothetical protein